MISFIPFNYENDSKSSTWWINHHLFFQLGYVIYTGFLSLRFGLCDFCFPLYLLSSNYNRIFDHPFITQATLLIANSNLNNSSGFSPLSIPSFVFADMGCVNPCYDEYCETLTMTQYKERLKQGGFQAFLEIPATYWLCFALHQEGCLLFCLMYKTQMRVLGLLLVCQQGPVVQCCFPHMGWWGTIGNGVL